MATETKTFYPMAYENNTFNSISGESNPVGKGSDSTVMATMNTSGNSNCKIEWPFDTSGIPEEATIDSVACKAKGGVSSTSLDSAYFRLYSGTTAKGGNTSYKSKTITTYDLAVGTWTRDELKDCRLRMTCVKTISYNVANYFYGADLTVTYTYNSEKFMLKTGGAWADASRVIKKVNGIWVEQTDLANVIEDGVRYKNGREIISPYKTVTITGSGNANSCYVTINGVKYTSATTLEVDSGTVIGATVGAGYYGASVSLNGTTVQNGAGTYNHTVNAPCTINLSYSMYGASTITITTS